MGLMSQTEKSEVKGMIVVKRQSKGGRFVGNWRMNVPLIDLEGCTACMLCSMYCPEAAISSGEEDKPEIDLRFCKGCGVCANECPPGVIEMAKEGE